MELVKSFEFPLLVIWIYTAIKFESTFIIENLLIYEYIYKYIDK